MGHFAQAFFAEQAKMHGGGESAERLIGADIGCGFLAADMLFTSGEGQERSRGGHLNRWFVLRGGRAFAGEIFLERR